MIKYYALFLSLLCLVGDTRQGSAQELPVPHIRLKAGIRSDAIALRWAVDQPVAWQKANKTGFTLKRYTLMRDGQLLQTPELKDLGSFQPKPLEHWKDLIDSNDRAAIVAQALYGESFAVEMGNQGTLQGIINKSREIEQRFAFALMAADLDFEIARLAGWGYVDKDVHPKERYLYVVQLNEANNTGAKILSVEKGSAIASVSEVETLPGPLDFIGLFQDKTVTLAWDYRRLSDIYTAYFIEKSEDSSHFTPLGNLPVMNMNNDAPGMIYIDSLLQNNKKYSYRIRGKTIFGDFGPYSEVISGAGAKGLEHAPVIKSFDIAQDASVKIQWTFPQEAEQDITGFNLRHSETDEANSYKIVKTNIPSNARTLVTQSLAASNYYKIEAVGQNNTRKSSLAVLVQPNDMTPPAVPTGLKGNIDSLGVVRLEWNGNTENDLEGYHIFRATQKDAEAVRLTPQALTKTAYQDTVQIASLNTIVYYYVTATDIRKNQSEPSPVIALEKPDLVKPQPPVFTDYKIENGAITLNWQKSYSEDVAQHRLYRMALDEASEWTMIFETRDIKPDYSYTDKAVKADKRYRYYLLAVDKSNLLSDKSQTITLRNTDLRAQAMITNAGGRVNKDKNRIELFWKVKDDKQVVEILVYRQKGAEKPALWGALSGAQNFLEDAGVQPGNTYTYLLRALLKSRQPSRTETITVAY